MTLDYYDSRNRVIDRGLAVYTEEQRVLGSWTGNTVVASAASVTYGSMWRARRKATLAYRYVGMDKATAQACAAAMAAKYTRSTRCSTWNSTGGEMGDWEEVSGGSVLMASVTVSHDGDSAFYTVEVDVEERDEQWHKRSGLAGWATENARDYDGCGEAG